MTEENTTGAAPEGASPEPTQATEPAASDASGEGSDTGTPAGTGDGGESGRETRRPTPVRESLDRAQIRERSRARAMARAGQAEDGAQAQDRPRDAKGRFLSPSEASGTAAPSDEPGDGVEEGTGGPEEDGGAAPESSGPAVRDGFVRIMLDEDDPLRERGKEYLDVPAEEEQEIRSLLNRKTRHREVEQAKREARELRARLKALQSSDVPRWTEENQETYDDLERHYDKAAAEAYKRGVMEEAEQAIENRTKEALEEEDTLENAATFLRDIQTHAPTRYAFWQADGTLSRRLAGALADYGKLVDLGLRKPSADHFFRYLDEDYGRDPQVQQAIAARRTEQREEQFKERLETEREALKREILEELGIQAQDRRDRTLRNPMGRLRAAPNGARAVDVSDRALSDEEAASPGEVRRRSRERAVARGLGATTAG